MRGSWRIARIQGIDVFVHWTFLILLMWIGLAHLWRGGHFMEMIYGGIFLVSVFACVVLHEFGHALTARRFGIETKDITLLPIGGVAQLEKMPRDPRQEFLVAIAGPAVNVVIAAVLAVFLLITRAGFPESFSLQNQLVGGPLLINLLVVNIVLVVFNMLPAFPMDGGRVLRAALASRMDYAKATSIAASVGQSLAIVLGIIGLFGNALLVLVAAFVYLGAEGENQMVQLTESLKGLTVRDAMMKRFRFLQPQDSMGRAADELLLGNQRDFPVVVNESLEGIVRQSKIIQGIRDGGMEAPVSEVMESVTPVLADDSLDEVAQRLRQHPTGAIPVLEHNRVVGMVSQENIAELVMIRSALGNHKNPQALGAVVNRQEPMAFSELNS